jgi:hypothetical protein
MDDQQRARQRRREHVIDGWELVEQLIVNQLPFGADVEARQRDLTEAGHHRSRP